MIRLVLANQATAGRRRVYFHLVAVDGITPATGEVGGQPQISSDGAAWTNTGIGTLSAIGNGRYSADLTQAAVLTTGTSIETRYKSGATAECPSDSVRVVAFDLDDAAALGLSRLDAAISSIAAAVWAAGSRTLTAISASLLAPVWDVLTSALTTVGSIGKLLVTDIDAAISSRAAAGVTVTVSSPVAATQAISIVRGDDYFAVDSASMDYTLSGLPTLIGGSCKLSFHKRTDPVATVTSFAGTILSATAVRFELTAVNTASLVVGDYDYDVQVTLAGGHIRTPVRGFASVLQDVSA